MAVGLILTLLWLFILSTEVTPNVSLQCKPKEYTVEFGQNLSVQWVLNSSAHHTQCTAKLGTEECYFGNKSCDCELQTAPGTNTRERKIQHGTVEIFNVTNFGTYTIFIHTNCGFTPNDTIEISKIIQEESIESPAEQAVITNTVMVVFAAVGLVIIAVVILGIRKYRRRTNTTVHQGGYQKAAEIC